VGNIVSRLAASASLMLVVAAALTLAGCGPAPTPSPTPTFTASPTATLTPVPSRTPTPPATSTPTETPLPTPAALGVVVPYSSGIAGPLEFTVLKTASHDMIVPGGLYYYRLKDPTKTILDVGILVRTVDPGGGMFMATDAVLTESDGTAHLPQFAGTKSVDVGTAYDPLSIGISQVTGFSPLLLERDTYIRLIYAASPGAQVLLGIEDSPKVSFEVP
jgi:hypothetical protein